MMEIKLVGTEQAISAILMLDEIWLIDGEKDSLFVTFQMKWNIFLQSHLT